MLADDCHRQGIKPFFYHSQLDWHHPDYYLLGRTGHASGRPSGGDFNKYLDYMDNQHGTRGGPITPRPWRVTTQKAAKIYVHVLDLRDDLLALPKLAQVQSAAMWPGGKPVEVKREAAGTVLRFPASGRDPIDTITVLNTNVR